MSQTLAFLPQPLRSPNVPWSQDPATLAKQVQTDLTRGLDAEEARHRLKTLGPNALFEEKKPSKLARLLTQFKSPVVVTLLIATMVSGALGEWGDAVAIVAIVVLNSFIGYLQESKAEEAIGALKRLSAPKARVVREGLTIEVAASEIVRGDLLVLEAGDYVSADARLLSVSQLSTNEALLTGESLPVTKSLTKIAATASLVDRGNMIFSGTLIATGSARAIVTATGMQSEIGKIAGMLQTAKREKTPLQKRLAQVGSRLLFLCLGVVILVALLGVLRQEPLLSVLMVSISLAVAAIPEGLPAVVTMALGLAIRRMTKRNAIIRQLPAVETLGSTDIICTDKTGTLTWGTMSVREVVLGMTAHAVGDEGLSGSKAFRDLVKTVLLCSNASLVDVEHATGDPTEVALLRLATSKGIDPSRLNASFPRLYEWSFDSVRKRMSVAIEENKSVVIHVKGAPESILPLCRVTENERAAITGVVGTLAEKGRRLLAVAKKTLDVPAARFTPEKFTDSSSVERDLVLLGLVALADPPRAESVPAIRECQSAGVKVSMITGDHPATARAIAGELGIVIPGSFDGVLTGPELEKLSEEELTQKVEHVAVYARVSPEDKLKIVKAWKARGKTVAMTGDGVNDAPALKEASIGISMGKGGTEVARQASSMILADDNFATIVSAIEEGRAIYGNIRRTIQYLLSGNVAELLVMLGASLAGWPIPLAPIHLLWINLVTDGLPALALAAEPVPKDVLKTTQRPSPGTFFDKRFTLEMTLVGVLLAGMALAVYGYSLATEDEITAKTHVFSFLVFGELFRSFASRSEVKTFFELGIGSNVYHFVAVLVPTSFQFLLHHTVFFQDFFRVKPLAWKECLILIALTLVPVTLLELRKWTSRWRQRP